MVPTRSTVASTRRWREHRWLVDAAIRTVGIEWDQPRIAYTLGPCGSTAAPDFQGVRDRVTRFVDVAREFERAAIRREEVADELDAEGRHIAASESYFIASLLYGSAQWGIFETNAKNLELDQHKTHCYQRYARHADHEVRRVEIPFEGGHLPGYLHVPPGVDRPAPAVLGICGMDTFKEMRHAIYGDRLLRRGFVTLAIDGPGQGEALVSRGITVTERNVAEAGRAAIAWLRAQPEVDEERVLLTGASFGSFWATQVAAVADGLRGTAVSFVCHEPAMTTLFEEASPTFKVRFMYMAGFTDEDAFDRWAPCLDLRPVLADIDAPYLAVAGEADELSPIVWTHDLFASLDVPKELVVYENEAHGLHRTPATSLGPNPHDLVADWLMDRARGIELRSRSRFVDRLGRVTDAPVPS